MFVAWHKFQLKHHLSLISNISLLRFTDFFVVPASRIFAFCLHAFVTSPCWRLDLSLCSTCIYTFNLSFFNTLLLMGCFLLLVLMSGGGVIPFFPLYTKENVIFWIKICCMVKYSQFSYKVW